MRCRIIRWKQAFFVYIMTITLRLCKATSVTKEWRQVFVSDNAFANSTNVTTSSDIHCALVASQSGWARIMRFTDGICQMATAHPSPTEKSPSSGFSLEGKRLLRGSNCCF